MRAAGINDSRIAALDLATGTHQVLMPGAAAKYVPSGHLVYFMPAPFMWCPSIRRYCAPLVSRERYRPTFSRWTPMGLQ
jgi:hypothetical protein